MSEVATNLAPDTGTATPGSVTATGAPGTATPPIAPTPAEAAEAARLSPKFAAAARKEAEAVKRMQAARTREEQVVAREQAIAAREAKAMEFEKVRGNPALAWQKLQELGITYDDLTLLKLNNGTATPEMSIKQIEERVEALAKQRETDLAKAAEERTNATKAEEEQLTTAFKQEIGQHIASDKAKYKFLNLYSGDDAVYRQIDAHYMTTLKEKGVGEIMTIPDACARVEAGMREEARKVAAALAEEGPPPQKIAEAQSRARFTPPVESSPWVEKPVRTLAGIPQTTTPSVSTRVLSDEERIANALAKLRAARG